MNTEIETITALAARAHENREQIVRRIAAFCAPVLRDLVLVSGLLLALDRAVELGQFRAREAIAYHALGTLHEYLDLLAPRAERGEFAALQIVQHCVLFVHAVRIALAETEAEIRDLAEGAAERMALLRREAP